MDAALALVETGSENFTAIEALIRQCGYKCELLRIMQGHKLDVIREPENWIHEGSHEVCRYFEES
jgi:hypothetical protein